MSKLQRLDKYLANLIGYSRKEIAKILKDGLIKIDGIIVKDGSQKYNFELVEISSEFITIPKNDTPIVIILNKPVGYECSRSPTVHKSVYSLLPKMYQNSHSTIGRLDVETSGIICFTDNGELNHYLSSPKHMHSKTYKVTLDRLVSSEDQVKYIKLMNNGILLRSEVKATLPAHLEFIDNQTALLTLYEGKYHQVRRMFSAVGNYVTGLERISFGALSIENLSLSHGQFKIVPLNEFKQLMKI